MIQQLVRNGFLEEVYFELLLMLDRVIASDGFYEWYTRDGKPTGAGDFRGSAGVLVKAIEMMKAWAELNK